MSVATPPPPKPERPLSSDCCDSGCAECVFTLYERELEQWTAAQAAWAAEQARSDATRSQDSAT